jgi:hypothetical protein
MYAPRSVILEVATIIFPKLPLFIVAGELDGG